jgi:putative ABC transport system permease protein
MIRLLARIAFAGIRARMLASILTVAIAAAVAAALVLALEVRATSVDPWQRTFDAAHGAHALANTPTETEARAFAARPGVSERAAPIPITTTEIELRSGETVDVFVAGLTGKPQVDAPVTTQGSMPHDDQIVLERSLAEALKIDVDATIDVAGPHGAIPLRVVGTAISPAQPRFPRSNPGLAWVTRDTLEQIQPDDRQWHWSVAVRLRDPSSAPSFAQRAAAAFPPQTVSVITWQNQRDEALRDAEPFTVLLTAFTVLLLIVAAVVVSILVGARAAAQHREIGLLKAVGLTPRQVGVVFVLESAVLGTVAAGLGFVIGAALAPRVAAATAATLLGPPQTATNPWHLLVATVVVVPVLAVSAYASSRRSARFGVLQAIQTGMPSPAPRSRLARAIARLAPSLPVELGLKDLLARRRRAAWLASAIAVTGAVLVFTVSVQAALNARPDGEISDVPTELPVLIYTFDAVLLMMTMTALVAVALLSVRERIRDFGVLKAIGTTPRDNGISLVAAHTALAGLAAIGSIPLGIALHVAVYAAAAGDTEGLETAPWWWLASVPLALTVLVAAAVSLPARVASRIRVAQAIRYE